MKLTVVLVALVVAVASTAAAAVVVPRPADASAQTITQCTTIDSPGHYVLGSNVSIDNGSQTPCIDIASSGVVLDGQGHTVRANNTVTWNATYHGYPNVGVLSNGTHNVTVRNVRFTRFRKGAGGPGTAVRFRNVTDGAVRNVTSTGNLAAVEVRNSTGVSVTDNTIYGGRPMSIHHATAMGVNLTYTTDSVVAGNSIANTTRNVYVDGGENDTVRGNALSYAITNVDVLNADSVSVANNTIRETRSGFTGPTAIRFHASQQAFGNEIVRGNTITGASRGIAFWQKAGTGPSVIANNTVRGEGSTRVFLDVSQNASRVTVRGNRLGAGPDTRRSGIGVVLAGPLGTRVDVEGNALTRNYAGIRVKGPASCVNGSNALADVAVHGNTIANNSDYGIQNEYDGVLNATHNYWGASNGPSSHGNQTYTDPVTHAPADGDGDSITGSNGTANVHFDPWSDESAPGNSTMNNSTAA